MVTQTPVFPHDCKKCQYLGTTLDSHAKPHDWYVCSDSVVARYGAEGHEYWSSLRAIAEGDSYLCVSIFNDPSHRSYINEKHIIARFMLAGRTVNHDNR